MRRFRGAAPLKVRFGQDSRMRARYHAAFSVGSGLAAWMLSRSCGLTLGIVIGGIVIDLDHLVDYVAHYGWRLDVRRFFRASYFGEYKRAFLPLHAWELWLLAACAALILPQEWLTGFTLGWGLHLLLDQVVNCPHPGAYSLLYRWRCNFRYELLFPLQARMHYSVSDSVSDAESESPPAGEKPASSNATRIR
ncbi:MAG: hypothetical protein DRP22_04150 [Verrucomicrobia bacterium]|nr:MAG: hypothetical protein DRP22_04150 [Verrucomicrobiota bacterium]